MLFRFSCPKCREPMGLKTAKCPHCAYRPMRHERRHAQHFTGAKLLTSSFAVGLIAYAVHYHR